ncbi:conserved hypothetical protein [Trichophyton verrucosum HKI 0517]|uniref:Uncharacterized protein n=1 Tax=Trichophyton verrucosum (strain HKI 0517) TaxID=663202 RepID=D4D1D7_TRIVH|nr:uncharacterized protein TRV_00887 [Trichophyton verrucosum HKI 0517]EFE44355.1 conserved hypothetical protein [Trichophyton verrucosum HKI 0517]
MPSSPISPKQHRRQPPSIDLSTSPNAFATNSNGIYSPQIARSSLPQSPVTPRQRHRMSIDRTSRYSADFTNDIDCRNGEASPILDGGLGSLADELADAWGDDVEDMSGLPEAGGDGEEYDDDHLGALRNGMRNGHHDGVNGELIDSMHDLGIGMGSKGLRRQDGSESEYEGGPRPSKPRPKSMIANNAQRHRRYESSLYDGSEYGPDSDIEECADISPALEARMAGIEQLVRFGNSEAEHQSNEVMLRVIHGLRDLGGQSEIESGASRLITAHASLTSHLTHQTRSLQTLTHPLLFSHFPVLSPDAIDGLIPLIDDVLPNLPFPVQSTTSVPTSTAIPHDFSPSQCSISSSASNNAATNPLLSLQALLAQTSDLTHTLRTLSDTLHESRQLTSAASRRLKSVRELVSEIRRDEEAREEGTAWIEQGEWDKRLREREAGRVCGDVVSGFEAVCGEWRDRLFGTEVVVA